MARNTNENNWFARRLPVKTPKKSMFHFTPDYKSPGKIGQLQPFYVEECIPGDKFVNLNSQAFIRLQPLFTPILHRMKVRMNYFFTPMRLFLTEENFNAHFEHGGDPDYAIPALRVNSAWCGINSLWDYMGCQPVEKVEDEHYDFDIPNPIPFLMYLKIWQTYYADEVLDKDMIDYINDVFDTYKSTPLGSVATPFQVGDPHSEAIFKLQFVSYTKDYFTTAQPEPYKGGDVKLFSGKMTAKNGATLLNNGVVYQQSGQMFMADEEDIRNLPVESADSISDLWKKMAIQRWINKNTVYGSSRYAEYLASHYGIITQDARLQMPEYLGGSDSFVNISQVIQTSQSVDDQSALGEVAGMGISVTNSSIKIGVQEHGYILGVISIVPDVAYTTGLPRWIMKNDSLDLAVPEFNNIGPQAVYNSEIYKSQWFDQPDPKNDGEFGYQPRYSEYRCHPSIAVGYFRNTAPFTSWHCNRIFTELPPLNSDFIKVKPADVERIFNSMSDDCQFFMDVQSDVKVYRPISYLPNPELL